MSYPTSIHLNFLRTIIDRPISSIRSDYKQSLQDNTDSTLVDFRGCQIKAIKEEDLLISGTEIRAFRLFAKTNDTATINYENCGWIMPIDIDSCMICNTSFGLFTFKHVCRSCGNIICNSCGQEKAIIKELIQFGPQRVCSQCCWGQEVVDSVLYPFAVPLDRTDTTTSVSSNNSSQLSRSLSLNPAREEEYSKDLLEFKQNASQNLAKFNIKQTREPAPSPTNAVMTPINSGSNGNLEKAGNIPMVLVEPSPGAILKTKRKTDQFKVFINVCTHTAVPYKHDNYTTPSVASPSTIPVTIEKSICMVCGHIRTTTDKSGNQSHVIDVVVHPNDFQVALLDATGAKLNVLCDQIVKFVSLETTENVDLKYTRLHNVSSRYKFSDNSLSTVEKIAIPASAEAFVSRRQWVTKPSDVYSNSTPSPVSTTNVISKVPFSSAPVYTQPSAPPLPLPSSDSPRNSSTASNTVPRFSTNFFRASAIDSIGADIDIKFYLIPVKAINPNVNKTIAPSAAVNSTARRGSIIGTTSGVSLNASLSFNTAILANTMPTNGYPEALQIKCSKEEMIIKPAFGYSISQSIESSGQQCWINICHHPLVGTITPPVDVTEQEKLGSSSKSFSSSIAGAISLSEENYRTFSLEHILDHVKYNYIISQISDSTTPPLSSLKMKAKNAMTYDIIISSFVIAYCVDDETGEARKKLTERITSIIRKSFFTKNKFDSSSIHYSTSYLSNSPTAVLAYYTLNILEKYRNSYAMALTFNKIVHKIDKYSDGLKIDLKKFPLAGSSIFGSTLRVFEDNNYSNMKCEGIDIRGASFSNISNPAEVYPLRISSVATDHTSGSPQEIVVAFSSDSIRSFYSDALLAHSMYQMVNKSVINAQLSTRYGWLSKQGHVVLSWRNRYCILHQGILYYYDKGPNKERYVPTVYTMKTSSAIKRVSLSATTSILDKTMLAGEGFKGYVCLHQAVVTQPSSGEKANRFRISVVYNGTKDYLFEADTADDATSWIKDINLHIIFANCFPYLLELKLHHTE